MLPGPLCTPCQILPSRHLLLENEKGPNHVSLNRQPPPAAQEDELKPRVSNVRILNTSLPWVHDELMAEIARRKKAAEEGKSLSPTEDRASDTSPHGQMGSEHPEAQTADQQAETIRRLKPHSRSTTNLDQAKVDKPQGLTPVPSKKSRQTKWQFGIRSRNQPYEAMACLYRALERQKASWRIDPQKTRKTSESDGENDQRNGDHRADSQDSDQSDGVENIEGRLNAYPNLPPDYYVPRDLWYIEARLLKAGVYPPGQLPSGSAHSSTINLNESEFRRKVQELGGFTEIGHDAPATNASYAGPPSSNPHSRNLVRPDPNQGVWVYIAIQLYTVEANNYMVDFKCDGYQNVVRDPMTGEWKPTTRRNKHVEKEVSSPYPYLDVASDLIAALAQAN